MKPLGWLFGAALTACVLFIGARNAPPPVAEEYQRALAAGEQALRDNQVDQASRNQLLLVALEKTLWDKRVNVTPQERLAARMGGQWKLVFLSKTCLNDRGLRACKGGEIRVTVNLLTHRADVAFLE
jgi:hypothetical protein